MVSEAIAKGDVHAINYFVAQKYIEALGEIAGSRNQKILMLPLDASSVIGAIGGISEIVRETFGDGDKDGGNGSRGGGSGGGSPIPRSGE